MCDILQPVKDQSHDNEKDGPSEHDEDIYEPAEPNLLNMPVEIILKICSLLDADFLKHTLSKVCKRFDDILADDHLWKYWVHSKMHGCFPTLPNLKVWEEVQIDWEEICVEMEVEKKKWSKVNETMKHIVVKDVHFASVDTVLLVNGGEICISGGRDRGVALWNTTDLRPHDSSVSTVTLTDVKPKHIRHDAHAGWVWDLTADNIDSANIVYSASWDNTVKAWDLASGFQCVEVFRCGMSALSVVSCDNIVMAGLYSKKILSFDLRCGPQPINSYKAHRGPVLALNCFNQMIASVSEDKTLAIWDRVAGKLMKGDIKIPSEKAYPVCINWNIGSMYIGDSKGTLHLFKPDDYAFVRSHEIWPESSVIEPSNKIAGCYQSKGNMIVCSDKGEIKFFYNCYPPQEYCSIQTSTYDVTQLRYLNGILVTGTCDSALEFWIPNEKYVVL